jgi:exo-1,4-beta-D-glucosaminidase
MILQHAAKHAGGARLLLLALCIAWPAVLAAQSDGGMLLLKSGWAIQSSAKIAAGGDQLSRPGFKIDGWYRVSTPGTVLAGLVENKVYPDPYFAKNLRAIPGTSYPIGANFSHLPMPADSPFRVSWWYRAEFPLSNAGKGKFVWLRLDGVNYRANVWMNGQKIADAKEIAGTFRMFKLDVSASARPGETNALAIEVFPPQPDDLAITFVDWNPEPPDKNMGLWRDVSMAWSGPVTVRHAQVITKLDLPSLDAAHLTITAELRNASGRAVEGTLQGWLEGVRLEQDVKLEAQEEKIVSFAPDAYPQLNLAHPRIWWPRGMGGQNLYNLELSFEMGGEFSDLQMLPFGISEVTSELDARQHRSFRINGKHILVRGAAWTPDMLLRRDPQRLEADFSYTSGMNLNTIRLEGKLDSDDFFSLADRTGLLVMAGWCCCDHWEKWEKWKPEHRRISAASLSDQIRRLRNHPSVLVWLNGSDGPPPADVEKMYLDLEKKYNWPKPVLSSAAQESAEFSGPSGVKMTGPYDYVPPVCWYEGVQWGGAGGFNTETSPGPAIPPIESLRKMIPAEKLWPQNDDWEFHAGGERFKDTRRYDKALAARYGPPRSLDDYLRKSQAAAYEGERAMFEAYGRNHDQATGVIQWMLNNAWPSLIWHLYDYFLRPAGGYFGTKKACEPLHVQYSYDDRSVVVVNDTLHEAKGLTVRAKVYDFDLKEKFSRETQLDSPADSSIRTFTLPAIENLSETFFLRLALADKPSREISRNFYWLSNKPDALEWSKTFDTVYTPEKSFADMTALEKLPPVELTWTSRFFAEPTTGSGTGGTDIRITNPTAHLAFLVHVKVTRGKGGEEILPVWWDDNYFELFPGETREIHASYRMRDLAGAGPAVEPAIEVDGWNVTRKSDGILQSVLPGGSSASASCSAECVSRRKASSATTTRLRPSCLAR